MAASTYFSLICLSIIQGITEWIPISSSGLLVIFEEILLLKDKDKNLLFNISAHTGSLFAVLVYFKKEIFNIVGNIPLFHNIIIATLPVIIIGFLVNFFQINIFLQDIKIVTAATIFFSIILYFSDKTLVSQRFKNNISNKNAFYIGLAQVIALIPGTSRSGITITCARFLGFSRLDSAKFSFLISIPTLFAATVLGIGEVVINFNKDILLFLFIGFSLSFVTSLFCIKIFLSFVEKNSLTLFVILRLFLGFALLFYLAN
ncbi:MAG: UDP-diphosphatase [Candidatus Pelagibacter sp.]|nr:UDP-diphosphatase [Candidatus Pelagibacter sp.]OUV87946.1 MAG: hypothetical protein CBC96_01175 [Pelagibacteraceae bacterium TMED136]|tara:strand:+ start:2757 stop:3536 length:780 start_codon:yes stop_codon:yes gene_type:complete